MCWTCCYPSHCLFPKSMTRHGPRCDLRAETGTLPWSRGHTAREAEIRRRMPSNRRKCLDSEVRQKGWMLLCYVTCSSWRSFLSALHGLNSRLSFLSAASANTGYCSCSFLLNSYLVVMACIGPQVNSERPSAEVQLAPWKQGVAFPT